MSQTNVTGTGPDRKPIIVVQGGQYGSEAKGLITAKLTNDRKVDVAIRTGTVNAGHTVYYNGKAYAMQQIPVSWIRPDCAIVLGPGAYIHPEILDREIEWVRAATGENLRDRLFIDRRCGLHLPLHTDRSAAANRHHKMGATGKGCSEAVVDKIRMRGDRLPLFRDWAARAGRSSEFQIIDTVTMVNTAYDIGEQVLIEGTQGTLLDLHLGEYPYVTHKQSQAASWLAESGLAPTLPLDLVLVMRTYPIRVAGNSGPFPGEISWATLARNINRQRGVAGLPDLVATPALIRWENTIASIGSHGDPATWSQLMRETHPALASEFHVQAWDLTHPNDQRELAKLFERTTVTKKLRRIATWSHEQARYSAMLNRPTSIALTFMNYEFPQCWFSTMRQLGAQPHDTLRAIHAYTAAVEQEMGAPVSYASFGPLEEHTHLWVS